MSVHDEINISHFIKHDGRQVDVFIKCAVDFGPSPRELILFW